MNSPDMFHLVALCSESLRALTANKWPLPRMRSLMDSKISLIRPYLIAHNILVKIVVKRKKFALVFALAKHNYNKNIVVTTYKIYYIYLIF